MAGSASGTSTKEEGLISPVSGCKRSREGAGRSVTSGTSSEANGDLVCEACGEPREAKKRWCGPHRRAADNMLHAAFKDGPHSHEAMAYKKIFGCRKTKETQAVLGLPDVAVRTLLDYVEMYPDGKEQSSKTRGSISVSQYVQSQGARNSQDIVGRERRWDLELFTSQMFNLRKWNPARCRAEFEKLRLNPVTPWDNKGPADGPLRLGIPAWMTGEDFDETRTGTYEQKGMTKSSKATNSMTDEVYDRMLQETRVGFSHQQAIQQQTDVYQVLPKGALTSESKAELQSGLDLLMKIARDCDGEGEKRDASQSQEKDKANAGGAHEFTDVGSTRNRSAAAMKKDIATHEQRIRLQLKLCLTTLSECDHLDNREFYATAKSRAEAALAWIGCQVDFGALQPDLCDESHWNSVQYGEEAQKPTQEEKKQDADDDAGETEQEGKEEKGGDTQQGDDEASAAAAAAAGVAKAVLILGAVQSHDNAFQTILRAMALKPVENIDGMMSVTGVGRLAANIQVAADMAAITTAQSEWENQKILISQLTASLRTARSDLARENKSRATRLAKQKDEEKAAAAEKTKKEQAEIAERHRKMLRAAKECTVASLDLVSMGHPSVRILDGDSGLTTFRKERIKEHEAWGVPIVVTKSELLEEALKDAKLSDTLTRWTSAFTITVDAKRDDKTAAPASDSHGVAALQPVLQHYMPVHAFVDQTVLPTLRSATQSSWFYGYTPTLAAADFEADFLGTMRMQRNGSTKLLFVSALDLIKVVPREAPNNKKSWAERAREALKCLTEDEAKIWHSKGASIYSASVTGPAIVYSPPGYLTFTKVTSNEPVSGLRHCFLCNSDAAEEAFKQLALLCPSSANAQDFCDCLALAVSKRT